MTSTIRHTMLGVRDDEQRGVIWHYTYSDGTRAWEPVVFDATGNRSLGIFADAADALKAWRVFVPFRMPAAA